jgi:hypothetical protein
MPERIHDRGVRAGLELQMILGIEMRRLHEVDSARVDDDDACTFAMRAFMREPNTGCASVGFAPMTRMTSVFERMARSPGKDPKKGAHPPERGEIASEAG